MQPFRIRHLLGREHGVVQITPEQYTSTIKSEPESVLTYLDDDDGEVITVGTSLELEQRLDDPVVGMQDDENAYLMHMFDIKDNAASLATWREHEAYTSKKTNQQPSEDTQMSATEPSAFPDLGMWTTDDNGRPSYKRYAPRDPAADFENHEMWSVQSQYEPLTVREDGPRSPILDLSVASITSPLLGENRSAEVEGESQTYMAESLSGLMTSPVSPSLSREKLNTQQAFASNIEPETTKTVPEPCNAPVVMLDKFIGDALQGLDHHLGGVADFFDTTAKGLRDAANKTREADVSALEGLLGGFKDIFAEVGKLGQSLLKSLDTEASAIAKDLAPLFEKHGSTQSGTQTSNNLQETRPNVDENRDSQGDTHFDVAPPLPPKPERSGLRSNRPKSIPHFAAYCASPLATDSPCSPPANADYAPNYRTLNDCPPATFPTSLKDAVDGQESKSSQPELVRYAENLSTNRLMKPSAVVANNGCGDPLLDAILDEEAPWSKGEESKSMNAATERLEKQGTESLLDTADAAPKFTKFEPLRPVRFGLDRSANVTDRVRQPLFPTYPLPPAMPKPMSNFGRLSWESHTSRQYATPSKPPIESENSDADFSTRYPPLTSLRRARTVAGLHETAKKSGESPFTTRGALHRYPSIAQLEQGKAASATDSFKLQQNRHSSATFDDKAPKSEPVVDAERKRPLSLQSLLDQSKSLDRDVEEASAPTTNVDPASTRALPGAWPEPANESQPPPRTSVQTLAAAYLAHRNRQKQAAAEKSDEQQKSGPRLPLGFRYVESSQSRDRRSYPPDQSGLHRSHTVAATNPAARLTRPFDPFPPVPGASHNGPRSPPVSVPSLWQAPAETHLRRTESERRSLRPSRSTPFSRPAPPPSLVSFDPWATLVTPPRVADRPTANAGPPVQQPISPRQYSRPHRRGISSLNLETKHTNGTNIDDCTRTLRTMGFGSKDPREAERLGVYASVANGDVAEAIEMLEDDRKASEIRPSFRRFDARDRHMPGGFW